MSLDLSVVDRLPLKWWQFDHVKAMLEASRTYQALADTSDTGTGKTFTALALARSLGIVPLIVCPLGTRGQWRQAGSIMQWHPEIINWERIKGRGKWIQPDRYFFHDERRRKFWLPAERVDELMVELEEDPEAPIPIGRELAGDDWVDFLCDHNLDDENCMNLWQFKRHLKNQRRIPAETEYVEEVKWGSGSYLKFKKRFAMVVFDEAHRGSGETSLESKLIIAAKRANSRIHLMSATLLEKATDFKAAGYALGLHGLSAKTNSYRMWALRNGCYPGTFGGIQWTEDPEKQKASIDRIKDALKGRLFRMERSAIPDFPETLVEPYAIDPEDAEASIVVGRLQDLERRIRELKVSEENARARESHLEEQIRLRQRIELLMLPAIKSLAIDAMKNGSAVIIGLNFHDSIDKLCGMLNGLECTYGVYDGRAPDDVKERLKKRFREDDLDVFIGQNQAFKEGVDLQHPYVPREVLISHNQSGRDMKQLLGRAHRAGGSFSRQRFLVLQGTPHMSIFDKLARKLANIDNFNDLTFDDSDFEI